MKALDDPRSVEIRDCAGKLQNAMKSARRQTQAVRRLLNQSEPPGVRLRDRFDHGGRGGGVRSDAGEAEFGISAHLDRAGRGDALRHLGGPLRGRRKHQVRSATAGAST